MSKVNFENPLDFEKVILLELEREGYKVVLPPQNTQGYDLIAASGGNTFAVQVKNLKAKVGVPAFRKLEDFLDKPSEVAFTGGMLVSASGVSRNVYEHIDRSAINSMQLGTFQDGSISWYHLSDDTAPSQPVAVPKEAIKQEEARRYIGVFTCKGGVGKTTVSAHLGGAFASCKYDVVLIDLDRQGNLRKLLDEGVYLPSPNKNELGTQITVIDHHEWDEKSHDEKIVVCDCNPEMDANPQELIRQFDYCIVPTTLNPLGINKNADVIKRTFDSIRKFNEQAELFVLINNYHPKEERRNKVLNNLLKRSLEAVMKSDTKCYYIDPIETGVAIRHSTQLMYWGYDSLIEGQDPELAFKSFGGRSFPRADFLALSEFIENHADLERFKFDD